MKIQNIISYLIMGITLLAIGGCTDEPRVNVPAKLFTTPTADCMGDDHFASIEIMYGGKAIKLKDNIVGEVILPSNGQGSFRGKYQSGSTSSTQYTSYGYGVNANTRTTTRMRDIAVDLTGKSTIRISGPAHGWGWVDLDCVPRK